MCFFCGCSGPFYKSVNVITPSMIAIASGGKKTAAAPAGKKSH